MSIRTKSFLLIFILVLIDQFSKIYIKLNFAIGEEIEIFSWFKIYFIENNGMAFGMEVFGKLFLTLFRIFAVVILAIFIHKLISRKARTGFILAVSVLLAGAVGNIFDSVFYGVLFSESTPYGVASFLPIGGGYAPIFHGKVVDMLFFPIITNGIGETIFFKWIFNVADSCVTISVATILLFFRKELNHALESKNKQKEDSTENESIQ